MTKKKCFFFILVQNWTIFFYYEMNNFLICLELQNIENFAKFCGIIYGFIFFTETFLFFIMFFFSI